MNSLSAIPENMPLNQNTTPILEVPNFEVINDDILPNKAYHYLISDDILPQHTTFGEEIATKPSVVFAQSLAYRTGNVLRAAKNDVVESPHKGITVSSGVLALGTQALDRLRVSVVLVPTVATTVFENTHEALPVALAAAGTMFAWNIVVGETLNQGLDQFPKAMVSSEENFPEVVDVFAESLPGLDAKTELASTKKTSTIRSLGKKALMHTRRALTGIGIGTTAYVATANVKGKKRFEISKLNFAASADTSLLVAGVAGGAAEAIIKLAENGHVELAQHVKDVAGSRYLWLSVAALSMLGEYTSNRRKKNQLLKEELATETTEEA